MVLLVRTIMATTGASASLVTKERTVNKVTHIPSLKDTLTIVSFILKW